MDVEAVDDAADVVDDKRLSLRPILALLMVTMHARVHSQDQYFECGLSSWHLRGKS